MEPNGMFIRKEDVEYGYLVISFGNEKYSFYSDCDECLSDPLPNIVRLILSLKLGRNYAFVIDDMCPESLLGIRTSFINNDEVFLELVGMNVSCKNSVSNCYDCTMQNECDYNTEKVKIEGILSRVTCIKMFEDFIKSIVEDVRYPKQYPGFSCLNDNMYDCIDDMVEKELLDMGIVKDDNKYDECYKSVEIRLTNERVNIIPENSEYIAKYDKMLREYIVPISWCLWSEEEDRIKEYFDNEQTLS